MTAEEPSVHKDQVTDTMRPTAAPGKNIVLCFDGTESKFGPDPYTNSLKFFRMLDKDEPTKQICYYQPGIGASMSVKTNTLWDWPSALTNTLDSAVAFSLDQHIKEAYKFLMRFYCGGDRIYLFGFSRGAFTARVLSSMIEKVGLLNPGLEELVDGVWSIYSAWEYAAQPSQPDYTTTLVEEFKNTFTRTTPPEIEFMGLFDTVNSVGLFIDRMFPYTTRFDHVKQIRHAVSLDERRTKYKQNLIYPHSYRPAFFSLKNTPTDCRTSMRQSTVSTVNNQAVNFSQGSRTESTASMNRLRIYEARKLMHDLESRLRKVTPKSQIHRSPMSSSLVDVDKSRLVSGEFQEVWFPGNHGDVGGGWAPDVNGQFLSNLSLRWMFSEAIKHGVIFQKDKLFAFVERYSSLDSLLSPVHDVLSLFKYNRTLHMTENEKQTVLQVSKLLFNKEQIPDFRSCAIFDDPSYEALFTSGVYLTSLRRLKSDIHGPESIASIFRYYQDLPYLPISGSDGRGDNSLIRTLGWWILELVPMGTKIENEEGEWKNVYIPNLGRSRSVPEYAQMHWSVLWRLKYCTDYKPHNLPTYVVELLQGREPVIDKNDYLLKKVIEETKQMMAKWDTQDWRIVPDDLDSTLRLFGYY